VWMPPEYSDTGASGERGALEPDTPRAVQGGHQEEEPPPPNQGFSAVQGVD
jgi:hypothetical protein